MPIASSGRDDRLTEAPRLSDCRTVRNVTAPAGASPAETAMPLPSGKEGCVVHVEVTDDGIAGVPHWRDIGDDSEGGRGFRLVNELAARWGFLREKAKARSSCWFEVLGGGAA